MSIAKNQKKLKKERKNSLNRFIQFFKNLIILLLIFLRDLSKISTKRKNIENYIQQSVELLTFGRVNNYYFNMR
jgi:hypothetical protein